MSVKHILYIVLLIFQSSFAARSQRSFSESINTSASVQTVVALTLTPNSSPNITFNKASDYVNGYTVSNFSTIAVKSNVAWNLYISSATSTFSNSGIYSTPNTPASLLQYNIEGESEKVVLSTTNRLLKAGNSGNAAKSGNTFNVSFTADPGYMYGPGTYSISTIYTISAQ